MVQNDIEGYCYNQEYFNEYKEGELLPGITLQSKLQLKRFRFIVDAGIILQRTAGEEEAFSLVKPILSIAYKRRHYTARLGTIDSENNHGLPTALIDNIYYYAAAPIARTKNGILQTDMKYRGSEEGLQFQWEYEKSSLDFWLTTVLLNTEEHLENLHIGLVYEHNFNAFDISGGALWNHHGGQLYHPAGQKMRDNITGVVELGKTFLLIDTTLTLTLDGRFLASYETLWRNQLPEEFGQGGEVDLGLHWNGFLMELSYFKGNNFRSWLGDFNYKADDYYHLELSREHPVSEHFRADWGVRFDFVDIAPKDYFKSTEHTLWFALSGDFDIFIVDDN